MAVRTRVDPVDRDIALIIDQDLSPGAQSGFLAGYAREALADAEAQNAAVLGRVPGHETFVDRVRGAPLESVRPDGVISFEFQMLDEVVLWIAEQLVRRSPFRSGRFAASFILFADGSEVDINQPPPAASEYVFLNTQPYARKIERGQSPQAPDGVFEAIAILAARRFGNTAQVGFGFRSPLLPYIPRRSEPGDPGRTQGSTRGMSSQRRPGNARHALPRST